MTLGDNKRQSEAGVVEMRELAMHQTASSIVLCIFCAVGLALTSRYDTQLYGNDAVCPQASKGGVRR